MLTITSVLTNPNGPLEVTDFFTSTRKENEGLLTKEEIDAFDAFVSADKLVSFQLEAKRLSLNSIQILATADVDEVTHERYLKMPEVINFIQKRNEYNARRGFVWTSQKEFS